MSYTLGITSKWVSQFGFDKSSSASIGNHWLVLDKIELNDFNNNLVDQLNTIEFYKNNYMEDKRFIKLDLGKIEELSGGETIMISKLFWIKLIQRKWKRVYKERLEIIEKRKTLDSLRYRSLNGCWPKECDTLPGLR